MGYRLEWVFGAYRTFEDNLLLVGIIFEATSMGLPVFSIFNVFEVRTSGLSQLLLKTEIILMIEVFSFVTKFIDRIESSVSQLTPLTIS